MKYHGETSFSGKSGAFTIVQNPAVDPVINVFLKSVTAFEAEDPDGYRQTALLDRAHADIRIGIAYDDIDEVWVTSNLAIDTLGLAGINEFMLALFEHQDQLNTAEDLITLLKELLNQSEVLWGVDYL
jgi:hypothetical protein